MLTKSFYNTCFIYLAVCLLNLGFLFILFNILFYWHILFQLFLFYNISICILSLIIFCHLVLFLFQKYFILWFLLYFLKFFLIIIIIIHFKFLIKDTDSFFFSFLLKFFNYINSYVI